MFYEKPSVRLVAFLVFLFVGSFFKYLLEFDNCIILHLEKFSFLFLLQFLLSFFIVKQLIRIFQ